MSQVREHDNEPLLGLPEQLPVGERLLWQGSPDAWALACRVLHVRKVLVWFLLIVAWRLIHHRVQNELWAIEQVVTPLLALLLSVTLLTGLAKLYANSTVYTLTNRRVTMRFGLAVQITMNIPFSKIRQANVSDHGNDTGNIAFMVDEKARVSHLVLWPNVRPWHWVHPQPMLCCVNGLSLASEILTDAVIGHSHTSQPAMATQRAGLQGA